MADRVERIALHEAAHCCIARKLAVPRCGGASIVLPNAHARFSCDCGAASICALMAGACAECLAFGGYDEVGVRTDRERWTQRLELLGYDDGGEALWARTLTLVCEHNDLILWLAQHLGYARQLDGPTIDRIVARG